MKKQTGMTLLGMLFTVVMVVFIGILLMRVIPVYIQHYTVTRSLDALEKIPESEFSTEPTANALLLRKKLNSQLYVNGVDIPDKQITIKPTTSDTFLIIINYDVVKPLFGNMNLLFKFDNAKEIKINGK